MPEWNILESKTVLDDKVRLLRRKCRGHYYSNYIWFSDAIDKQFPFTRFWLCEEGDNMLLLQQYGQFFKLFYFVGDIGNLSLVLPEEVGSAHVLCELFEEENKEKQTMVLNQLCLQGFSVYRKFYMWECSSSCLLPVLSQDKANRKISYGDSITHELLKSLFDSFDPYVDLMPLPELFDEYYNNKRYLTCNIDGRLAGIVVYTIKDNTVDEDFIYVFPEFRGIGKILYGAFMNKVFNELHCKTIVPWVHTENGRSIAFHAKVGAVQTPYYKVSLLTNK